MPAINRKGIKSILIETTNQFPKIHDLVKLGELVKIDKELLQGCERLSQVYIETRYPDVSDEEYTKEETEEDIKIAERILKWTINKLS